MLLAVSEALEKQQFLQRLDRAVTRSKLDDIEIARQLGMSKQQFSQIRTGERPGWSSREQIARILNVDQQWLDHGDRDKAPSWARHTFTLDDATLVAQATSRPPRVADAPAGVDVVGCVTAGDGDIGGYEDLVESVEIPTHWKIVVVHGMSAYPVFYPEQLAWVDMNRAACPSEMTEKQYVDLHDNVVVVQAEVRGKKLGLLKRFNYQPDSPQKFALSSLDAGRSSPYIAPDDILVIVPVVGSWWEDPRRPRKKRFHARSVIVKLIDEDKL